MSPKSHESEEARLYYQNRFVHTVRVYSFFGFALVMVANLFIAAYGLINDSGLRDLTWLYVALAFALVSLGLLAYLGSLIFGGGRNGGSRKKQKIARLITIVSRGSDALAAVAFMAYAGVSNDPGDGFLAFLGPYGLLIATLEIILLLYEWWRFAWIEANPERYGPPSLPEAKAADSEGIPTAAISSSPPAAKELTSTISNA